jgi:hypothetical protein
MPQMILHEGNKRRSPLHVSVAVASQTLDPAGIESSPPVLRSGPQHCYINGRVGAQTMTPASISSPRQRHALRSHVSRASRASGINGGRGGSAALRPHEKFAPPAPLD